MIAFTLCITLERLYDDSMILRMSQMYTEKMLKFAEVSKNLTTNENNFVWTIKINSN